MDGRAGTGKSHLIAIVSTNVDGLFRRHSLKTPILRAAPTGVAAYGIKGRTIHSLLRLPVRGKFQPLPPQSIASLQATFQGIGYLIIDEKSMMNLRQLSWISARLNQI